MPKYRIEPVNKKCFIEWSLYGEHKHEQLHAYIERKRTWRFGAMIIEAETPPPSTFKGVPNIFKKDGEEKDEMFFCDPDVGEDYYPSYPFEWEFEFSSDLVDDEYFKQNISDEGFSEVVQLIKEGIEEEENIEIYSNQYEIKCPFTVTELEE